MLKEIDPHALYLDFLNNFLTHEKCAEHYQIDIITLCCKLREGRLIHEGWLKPNE